jgi:glutaredoxin
MTIKLFVKDDCPRCPAAKKACEGIDGVEVYDVAQIDGLAEASFYGVLATPSVLVIDADGREVASWRGEAPDRRALATFAGTR